MKKISIHVFLFFVGSILFPFIGNSQSMEDYASYVNPLQGTNSTRQFSTGNTYPAVATPWGLNFWVAQTGDMGDGWQYTYNDTQIKGFKQTHQPSPWINDYGCFSIMPVIGGGKLTEQDRASAFSHNDETSTPYYYSVQLKDYGINTEMTATHSSSFFRFTFPKTENARVIIDAWKNGSKINLIPQERKITGYSTWHTTNNDNKLPANFATYFVLIFDKDFEDSGVFDDYIVKEGKSELESNHAGAFVSFKTQKGEQVTAKISSSFISLEQAELNLSREIGNKSFGQVTDESKAVWNKQLGRVNAEGGDKEQLTTFYTALYRMMLFPRKFHEFDEDDNMIHYSAMNGKIENGPMYTDNGFWDTFRAVHPFFTIMYPQMSSEIMQALLNYYKEGGWMPEWSSPGYRNCMIGQNSTSLIADAYTKGIRGFDANSTWEAVVKGANHEGPLSAIGREGADYYNRLGYVPYDEIERGSVSKTLEYAYNDFCIALFAKAIGKSQDIIDHYFNKALNYKNVFDQSIGFMRPKDSEDKWKMEHWKPDMWGGSFTEGSAWHWTWSVFHDPQGLINLFGGKEKFTQKLDSVFTAESTYSWYQPGVNRVIHEMAEMVAGNMGQYAHGNQPIQHAIYLYNFAAEPYKAQKWTRHVMDHLYSSGLEDGKGLCGDEDNGQTSAWYVFSAMGFYPLCPGTGQYIIGSPLFKKVTLDLPNGKKFAVIAHNNSDKNIYIQSASLNSEKFNRSFLTHEEIIDGGTLEFEMGATPNKEWGNSEQPFSLSGVNKKQDGKHLFILAGQSNMARLQPKQSFAPALAAEFGKENMIIVKDAHKGRPIRRWYRNWKPLEGDEPKSEPDLYDSLMAKVNVAVENEKINTVTFVWMQGERDAKEKSGNVYERSLIGLYHQLSIDLKRKDINFVIGRLSDHDMQNKNFPDWSMIRDIQVKVADSNRRFGWIDTDDLNDETSEVGREKKNDLHMSAKGYITMGKRFADKSIQLIKTNIK